MGITLAIEGAIGNLKPLTKPKLELLHRLYFALTSMYHYLYSREMESERQALQARSDEKGAERYRLRMERLKTRLVALQQRETSLPAEGAPRCP